MGALCAFICFVAQSNSSASVTIAFAHAHNINAIGPSSQQRRRWSIDIFQLQSTCGGISSPRVSATCECSILAYLSTRFLIAGRKSIGRHQLKYMLPRYCSTLGYIRLTGSGTLQKAVEYLVLEIFFKWSSLGSHTMSLPTIDTRMKQQ